MIPKICKKLPSYLSIYFHYPSPAKNIYSGLQSLHTRTAVRILNEHNPNSGGLIQECSAPYNAIYFISESM